MEKQSTAGFWLSPQQKHVWAQQGDAAGNVVAVVGLSGPLDEGVLQQALGTLIARHEVLRTVFQRQAGMKVPFQVIREHLAPSWQAVDASNLAAEQQQMRVNECLRAEQSHRFSLETGPVVRATVIKLNQTYSKLILCLPNLLSDFPSLRNLVHEWGVLYGGEKSELNAEPLRYVQFAQWQSDLLESDDEAAIKAKEHWAALNQATSLAIPLADPAGQGTSSIVVERLEEQPSTLIEDTASKLSGSIYGILLAAWQALLARLTGQTSFAVRAFLEGREYDELQDAPGLMGKFLPVPGRFDGDFRFSEIVQSVERSLQQSVECQEHFIAPDTSGSAGFEYHDLGKPERFGNLQFAVEDVSGDLERCELKLVAVR
ncbi:MAG TPA: condensation domain-containing protein, partial [Terriglobales bacterium]|nr:condensation domain-containing protein [Terriglobales bacterium]